MIGEGRMAANFEAEFCPEAILQWCREEGKNHELSQKAKKHLSAMGWVFWYAPKNGRRELRYQSPGGKVFYSLRAACKSYIDEGGRGGGGGGGGGGRGRGGEGEETRVVARDLEPKKPRKRKSFGQENQPACQLFQPNPPKRGKNLKKHRKPRKNQTCLRVLQVRERPKSVLSALIDYNAVSLLGKVYYRDKKGNPLKKGRITRDGIQCDCCFRVFTLTAFEAHAGSTNHRPSANIMLDDGSGRSLSDCQKQARDSMVKRSKEESPKTVKGNSYQYESDEVCSVCRYGGDLICCDHCPSAFHVNCLGLHAVPDGAWFCPSCCCKICGIGHLNDDNFLTCQQCELKFHVGCRSMKESNDDLMNSQWGKNWFCSHSCEKVFSGLQKLTGKPILVGNNLTWTLLKSDGSSDSDLTDDHSKLSVAVEVMHECFEPSKDFYTGRDLVEDVIFSRGSGLKRMDFKGFYTVALEEDDDMVTAATVRIYGDKVAEMPLVATRFGHRRHGMCRALVDELENNLMNLGVEKLVLPAVPSALDTWTNNFGFSQMTDEERSKLLQYTLLDFQGTIMCQKVLKTQKDL